MTFTPKKIIEAATRALVLETEGIAELAAYPVETISNRHCREILRQILVGGELRYIINDRVIYPSARDAA